MQRVLLHLLLFCITLSFCALVSMGTAERSTCSHYSRSYPYFNNNNPEPITRSFVPFQSDRSSLQDRSSVSVVQQVLPCVQKLLHNRSSSRCLSAQSVLAFSVRVRFFVPHLSMKMASALDMKWTRLSPPHRSLCCGQLSQCRSRNSLE